MAHQVRWFVGAVLSCGLATAGSAEDTVVDVFAHHQQLGRGVNILGYDLIWRSRAGTISGEAFPSAQGGRL